MARCQACPLGVLENVPEVTRLDLVDIEEPLQAPVLLCRPIDAKPAELDPYVVDQIAPAGWFALGSGNGLRVWVTWRPQGAQEGDDVKATAKVADAPLGANAWEQAF